MKRIFVLCFLMLAMMGCSTWTMYQDKNNPEQLIDEAAYNVLPPEQKEKFVAVTVEGISPSIGGKITSGLNIGQGVGAAMKPFIPLPYGDIGLAVLAGLSAVWLQVSKARVKTTSNRLLAGLQIAGSFIEEVKTKFPDFWKDKKTAVSIAAVKNDAIMGDEVIKS